MTSLSRSTSALESLGIDEVEPNVCEDSYENRKRLRANGFYWEAVKDEDRSLTGLIECFHGDALAERRDSTWERRKPIMVDPDDRYSEYVGPDEYPMDFPDMPWWLKIRKQRWVDIQLGRAKHTPAAGNFPVRCEVIRHDGTRCWNWAPRPDQHLRCKQHRTWVMEQDADNATLARLRVMQAAPAAADNLIELAFNADSDAVRLKATTDVLAISGVRGGTELDVKVQDESGEDPAKTIQDRIDRLVKAAVLREQEAKELAAAEAAEAEQIVDAEVVSDVTDGPAD